NMDTKSLQSLTIDARQLDDDNHCVYMAETCKTIISNQELRNISTERFTRLRLDGQIELDACGPMELSFNFGSGAIGSFELRYITLESGQNSIYDQVLYGEGKPQQLISIGHGKGSSQDKTLNVHSYAISSSGYEPESLSDENYFEVVLEKDHFLVLGQTNTSTDSIVEPEEGGCRRLISTRDMSVAKTLSIHQDYEIQYPVPITGPAFTYAQGSIVNIVKDANALTPPRDRFSSCGHDCIMDMLPVDLLLEDETLEYAYNETIVLNMMATQTRIHGSRITFILHSIMPKQHQKPQKKATQQQQQQHHLGSPTVGPLPTNSTAIETTKTYTTNRPLSPTALDAINIFQSVQTPEKGWYLRNTIEGVHGSLKYGPLPAVVVRAGPRWK
ncbi:hypothetical protein BX616_006508, partial [Lobosporangium transversale]